MIHSFKYTGINQDGNDVYELYVQLPDSEIPDTQQHLAIKVIIKQNEPADLILDVLSSNTSLKATKKWRLASTTTGQKDVLARLLYPVARMVTKIEIQPTGV